VSLPIIPHTSVPSFIIQIFTQLFLFFLVYVGGFDEVCLDKDVYKKIVVQSKPNKMSLLLAEALYGNETLGQSTITGKIGTRKLDEVILNAIKGVYIIN